MSVVAPPPPPPPSQTASSAVGSTVIASRVSKWFGDVVAVSDVSFAVSSGVTALLGPNGAGKSTMLRMLAGLAPASQGEISVLGADPRKDKDVRGRIGLVPQQEGLFAEQRAIEFVTLAAKLNKVPNPRDAAAEALGIVELDPDDVRPTRSYSKGMKQRVKVAQALVHEPDLLLMDEPLTGLDPRQRLHMIELIQDLGSRGVSVIVSSHVLDEVERLGSRVLVIAQGRLAAQGDFHEIRALMDDRPHRIRVRTNDPRKLGAALLTSSGVNGVTVDASGSVLVDTDDVEEFRRTVAPVAKHFDLQLLEVRPLDDDLESVFKYLVGR
ncbi:MAG: ABC transporter ATP-binding protein [Acidimicrobiia bacterium]|nr:ABC transporter ATP-binding protein [Acidimicrobiia bacterium]